MVRLIIFAANQNVGIWSKQSHFAGHSYKIRTFVGGYSSSITLPIHSGRAFVQIIWAKLFFHFLTLADFSFKTGELQYEKHLQRPRITLRNVFVLLKFFFMWAPFYRDNEIKEIYMYSMHLYNLYSFWFQC